MNTINVPIHSTKTLIKASLLASVIASVLLITCILPSEYNIDPTGVGEALGLTKLSQTAGIPEPLSTPNSTSAVKGDIVQILSLIHI